MQEIICVLDKSGSMQGVATDAVGGFNTFLKEQKELGEANLSIFWFDTIFTVGYEGRLSSAKPIEYWPNGGMTALYDAIGKSFEHVKERFTKEKPEKVILAILTDGLENASVEFTSEAVKNLITEHQDKYGWTVIFLAADQDAWGVGSLLGMNFSSTYAYDSSNTMDGFATYSAAVTKARLG